MAIVLEDLLTQLNQFAEQTDEQAATITRIAERAEETTNSAQTLLEGNDNIQQEVVDRLRRAHEELAAARDSVVGASETVREYAERIRSL